MSASSSDVETREDEEVVPQDLASVALQSDAPLRVLSHKKLTVKGLAIDVQDKANSLFALEKTVHSMRQERDGFATKEELEELHEKIKNHLRSHADDIQEKIEESNAKLLSAIVGSASNTVKENETRTVAESKIKVKEETIGQDRGAVASKLEKEDWADATLTQFEQSVVQQVKKLLLRRTLDKDILLPALGSILEMRQLDDYKRNFSASAAALAMSLLRDNGIHVCSTKGQLLRCAGHERDWMRGPADAQ